VIFSPGGPADHHLEPVFTAQGCEGGGYDWESAVRGLLVDRGSDLSERVGFDSEAGMFCAYGTDLDALHGIALALESLLADPDLLARALRVAGEHDLLD
jgi:hypothetical protein